MLFLELSRFNCLRTASSVILNVGAIGLGSAGVGEVESGFLNLAKKEFRSSGLKLLSIGEFEFFGGNPVSFLMSFQAFAGSSARCSWVLRVYLALDFLFL